MANDSAALQINLTPADLRHAIYIVPHQIQNWIAQVDRIMVTVDTQRSHGRYARGWEDNEVPFDDLLNRLTSMSSKVSISWVDYSSQRKCLLGRRFLGGREVPDKDLYGAPFHAYLDGLSRSDCRYVFHTDSDMLYGGGSATWIDDAIERMQAESDILVAGPLPGPPTATGEIPDAVAHRMGSSQQFGSRPLAFPGFELRFKHVSTRSYLIDVSRFESLVGSLEVYMARPPLFSRVSPGVLPLEVSLSGALHRYNLWRLDMLGTLPGMWTLHPPYRNAEFYARLSSILEMVERGDVPDAQRGDFDMNDSLIDWSKERRKAARQEHKQRLVRLFQTGRERWVR